MHKWFLRPHIENIQQFRLPRYHLLPMPPDLLLLILIGWQWPRLILRGALILRLQLRIFNLRLVFWIIWRKCLLIILVKPCVEFFADFIGLAERQLDSVYFSDLGGTHVRLVWFFDNFGELGPQVGIQIWLVNLDVKGVQRAQVGWLIWNVYFFRILIENFYFLC